jgi:nucleoside recognition membrane protein YjiH
MKKAISLFLNIFFFLNCFLLPPSAKFNNPTDNPLAFVVNAIEALAKSLESGGVVVVEAKPSLVLAMCLQKYPKVVQ